MFSHIFHPKIEATSRRKPAGAQGIVLSQLYQIVRAKSRIHVKQWEVKVVCYYRTLSTWWQKNFVYLLGLFDMFSLLGLFLFLLGQDSMLLPHPSDLRRVKPGRTRRRGQAVTGPQSTNTASMEIQRNATSPENDSLKHLSLQTIERKPMISFILDQDGQSAHF